MRQLARRTCLAFFLIVLGGCVAGLLAQTAPARLSDLTGFWVFRVPTGDGNVRESFLDLKQDGDVVTGKLIQGKRETTIAEGTYRAGALHFVAPVRAGNPPQERKVVYDGTANGDHIELTSQFPGRSPITGSLERSTPAAALPPAPLPLPALHDVPDNGLARTPPMGWNSWNNFAGQSRRCRPCAASPTPWSSSGMKDAGYIYVNIDDTWEGRARRAGQHHDQHEISRHEGARRLRPLAKD